MGWIITTFFYPRFHPDRLYVSAWILISIMLSTTFIPLGLVEISGTGFFMLLSAYWFISRLHIKQLLYILLSTFILMLVTACFLVYELYDPVWVVMKREWMIAIIVTCITLLLLKNQKQRIVAMFLGTIQGEILYSLILTKYSFSYPVATLFSLDSYALSLSLVVGWNFLELIAAYFDKQFQITVKEKQKLL
ncbi:hypothetical protein Q5760_17675 [Niallia sp. Krafla_26]